MRKLLCLLTLLLMPFSIHASGDDLTNILKDDSVTNVATETTIGGNTSKAFAFAHGLGDVDINQCLGSTQWGTIIVSAQKLVLNKWCAAEVYDAKGMYSMAARVRCLIPEIKDMFPDAQGCILENTYTPPPVYVPTPGPDEDQTRPDEAGEVSEWGDGPSPGVELVQMEIETLEQRLARVESGQRIAAQKSQDRRDYAQMTIQRLENDPEE